MSRVVLLDAGPLGEITHPKRHPNIKTWMAQLLQSGVVVRVPEIADYEVRRELIRASSPGISRLDLLKEKIGYIPINTDMMLIAARFWAQARNSGIPTAHDKALDADVILMAQASVVASTGDEVIVATTNVGHLSRFGEARHWRNIN